jgi:RND family efflux transporter MFP subunit
MAGCQPSGGAAPGSGSGSAKPEAPAKVEGAPKEADLATVTLTTDAETRLGVVTAPAARKPVARTTTYAGEVMVPSGRLTAVTSPFVGTLKAPSGGAATPTPGAAVKEGQPVFVLVPILSPESQATMAPLLIESEGQVKQATEQLHIAKLSLDRAEGLVKTKAASAAMLVDARAQYDLAQTNLRAAEARHETLAKVSADAKSGSLKVAIASPASGILQNVHAQVGQTVAAGAALFEVVGLDPVWIKVPVYVGDTSRLAADRPAVVGGLADAPGAAGERPAKPVVAPPSGDPLAATVNIFYEVSNADGRLRPGERVGVTLPLKGEDESLTVPRSALVRDIHGGAWVYEKVKSHAYARKRVSVDRVVGDLAVLSAAALKPGAEVVTVGAAELYGAEFGGK